MSSFQKEALIGLALGWIAMTDTSYGTGMFYSKANFKIKFCINPEVSYNLFLYILALYSH